MDAAGWDERYRSAELVWGARPNRWVEQELADLSPGTAIDLACGEGRNALWLAGLGWNVTAVDFSAAALETGRRLETAATTMHPIDWVCADATTYESARPVDLVVVCYLHLLADMRRSALLRAAAALASGATLFVVGHDTTNIGAGTGGPQDPAVLFSAADLVDDLDGTDLVIDRAEAVLRPVEGADRDAIDALLRAHRP